MGLLRFLSRSARRLNRTDDYRKRLEFVRPKLGLGLFNFSDDGEPGRWSLFFLFVWVRLWRAAKPPRDPDGQFDEWGITIHPIHERYVYLHWGTWHKFLYLPWSFDWVDTAAMNVRGEFVVYESRTLRRDYTEEQVIADQWEPQRLPFGYLTRYGETQRTTATVRKVERRRWRWKLCRWLRLPVYRVRYDLDISFADEMGSERGSWKGGVVGASCAYIPGESVEAALRRYEARQNATTGFCR